LELFDHAVDAVIHDHGGAADFGVEGFPNAGALGFGVVRAHYDELVGIDPGLQRAEGGRGDAESLKTWKAELAV